MMAHMATVAVQNVTKQFGTQIVLSDITLDLHNGEIVGLVGANGSGKTTLFRLIAGELRPDQGTVTTARGTQIGLLRQEPDIRLERTLHDEVGSVFAELLAMEDKLHALSDEMAVCEEPGKLDGLMDAYERINARFITAGGHQFETRLNEILGGLGFAMSDYTLPMSALSGGQKCRASLAKLLLGDRSFLLLDEPTNHLDIDAVRWLEKFLTGHHGGAVVISHDRYLLDRLCQRIIEVDRRRVTSYPGNYSNYVQTRERRLLTQERQFEKDAAFIQKEQAFIAKHMAGQRTKEAQGRRTRLTRRMAAGEFETESPTARRQAKIKFEKVDAQRGTVLRCDELAMAYGENRLFSDLTFQVQPGQRLGITGPNGTGKTTLLNVIVGKTAADAGTVTIGSQLSLGYYEQEHAGLDPERTVLEEIRTAHPTLSEQHTRSLLGRYLFTGDDVFKPLGSLSGGEQSRVRLANLILQAPDVLILDEPTNHLDIPSREALEESLSEFPGSVVVVSHDRYFLDRIVDRLLVLRRDGHRIVDGNYSDYLAEVEQAKAPSTVRNAESGKKSKRKEATPPKPKTGPSPYDAMSVDQLEALVIEKETELATLHAKFGDSSVYQDPDALAELREEMAAAETALAEVDRAWHDRVETQ